VAVNPLECRGNYIATSNNMKLLHWPLMSGCYSWYSEEETGRGPSPPRPLLAVPNVTAHPSTASVPSTVLLYNGPLLCGFNVPFKGLTHTLKLAVSGSNSTGMYFLNYQCCNTHNDERLNLTRFCVVYYQKNIPQTLFSIKSQFTRL